MSARDYAVTVCTLAAGFTESLKYEGAALNTGAKASWMGSACSRDNYRISVHQLISAAGAGWRGIRDLALAPADPGNSSGENRFSDCTFQRVKKSPVSGAFFLQ
jgi:hypothetical protein